MKKTTKISKPKTFLDRMKVFFSDCWSAYIFFLRSKDMDFQESIEYFKQSMNEKISSFEKVHNCGVLYVNDEWKFIINGTTLSKKEVEDIREEVKKMGYTFTE